jgi:hypothetical protein
MVSLDREARSSAIRRFASRLRFPYLFVLLVGLLVLDLLLVDPIPFIDEIVLGLLAVLVGMWKERRANKVQKTPPPSREPPSRQLPE